MLDSDLARFYGVETRRLNEQVKRNIERFPEEFMFQLTYKEQENLTLQITRSDEGILRSQNAILKKGRGKHRKYLSYVFTEQGVAMLSSVLKSDAAVKMSIQIINAFVTMRKFLINNANLFQRIDWIERKQVIFEIETTKNFDEVFNALQSSDLDPRQGIFFDGQIFDAHKFVSGLIRKAEESIILIDNYIDETVLDLFRKRNTNAKVTILTRKITKELKLDLAKYNSQYPGIEIKEFTDSHDRFIIIDDQDVYPLGASLKDLGKKWFAFSKFDKTALQLLEKLREKNYR